MIERTLRKIILSCEAIERISQVEASGKKPEYQSSSVSSRHRKERQIRGVNEGGVEAEVP